MGRITEQQVYDWLADVTDPEVPALNILDLGIVRKVEVKDNEGGQEIKVFITPTYSGCPAMDVIAIGIRMALAGHGAKLGFIRKIGTEMTKGYPCPLKRPRLRSRATSKPWHIISYPLYV